MDPSKIDFSFMKSGNNIIDNDVGNAEKIRITAILTTYMQEAVKSAAIYVEHSERKIITPKDIQLGLKMEIFLFMKKELKKEIIENEKEIIKDFYSNLTEEEEEDDSEYITNETEDYKISNCKCGKCVQMNLTNKLWNSWKPETNLEHILKKNIDLIKIE